MAAWVTAGIAVAAGVVAWRQLGEARQARKERDQPYVAAFMDDSPVDPQFKDLVVRNFGATAATDVALKITPPPRRAVAPQDGDEEVWIPSRIPTLVPGQEWRTLWDYTPDRASAAELPNEHTASVSFADASGRRYAFEYELDWGAIRSRMNMKALGTHQGVKALQEIGRTLKGSR